MIIVLGFGVTLSNSVCKKDSYQAILTPQVLIFFFFDEKNCLLQIITWLSLQTVECEHTGKNVVVCFKHDD